MKIILLVRHAKSSWANFEVTDEDRPLNERGKKNAPEMAKRLLKRKISIDAFISSPARRARDTAAYFAEAYGVNKNQIVLVPELYMARHDDFVKTIRNAPQNANCIAIFSHNNGITDFANVISNTRIDEMPTCAVFAVKSDIDDWTQFYPENNEYYFFDYPKNV